MNNRTRTRKTRRLDRRTWAIMVVLHNPRLRRRLPRLAAEVDRIFGPQGR